MNLDEFKSMANQLIKEHCPEYRLEITKTKITMGLCNSKEKIISVSIWHIKANDEATLKNTILHEIAHAISPAGEMHGKVWKSNFLKLGGNGLRLVTKEATAEIHNIIPPKYIYQCPSCLKEERAYRKWKLKKACGGCCRKYNYGKYSEKFIMVIEK